MGNVYNKIGGGKKTTLTTKSITSNGTYNASSDNADGYSSVTVSVPQSSRVLLWSGSSSDNVSVSLSGYSWVYVVISPSDSGATGCNLLLQVGGAAGSAGIYRPYEDSVRQYARKYQATSSGITALSDNADGQYLVTAVYGISNLS